MILAPHGRMIPINLIHEQVKKRNFPDIDVRTNWPIDVAIKHIFKSKRDALIQIPGNWKIFKRNNDLEVYKCAQCKTYACLIQKPTYIEATLVQEEGENRAWHEPFNQSHLKIGKEIHESVALFIKKYAKLGSEDPIMLS